MYVLISTIVALLLGISPIIVKYGLNNNINVNTIFFINTLIYVVCGGIYALLYKNDIQNDLTISNSQILLLLTINAFFAIFVANIIYYLLIQTNNTAVVTALAYSSPVFTVILSYFILNEKINLQTFIAICMIYSGILMISLQK
jgi:drug/metabolite transporter (DMT)-like permease